MKHMPEILAPVGDWAHLAAALKAGADAVYFGVGELNMRSSAPNFLVDDLPRLANKCHRFGARAYLALNTLIYEDELETVDAILDGAATAGIDAVIGWDPAVLEGATSRGLELHLSTQASVANPRAAASYAHHYGVSRIVLARECTLAQIQTLMAQLPAIEIEVFAHGAMCVAVSGRCLISSFQYGKSANRGECYQPCRREYRIVNDDEGLELTVGSQHVMSPNDLCTLPFLESLITAGIHSLKIEGRNRSPEYVATAVTAYREVRDAILDGTDNVSLDALKQLHIERLSRVFNRGFSSGFYLGRPLDQWTGGGSEAVAKKEVVGIVTNYFSRVKAAEILIQAAAIGTGDTLIVQGPTTGSLEFAVTSMQIDGEPVERGSKGMYVAIQVPERIRRNDRVFVVRPA